MISIGLLLLWLNSPSLAQQPSDKNEEKNFLEQQTQKNQKKGKSSIGLAIAFGGPLTIITVGSVNWWLNHAPEFTAENFTFWNRGWFGQTTYTGGHDKIGHFNSNYIFQHVFTGMYEDWAGYSRHDSIWLGALTTFIGFNLIELFDAFTDYGWEYGDSVMNVLGQGLAIISQLYGIDNYIQMRLAWVPSPDYINKRKIEHYEFLEDYNGQRFFFVINTAGISKKHKLNLRFFKYIMPAIYYDTRGYRPEFSDEEYHLKERNLGGALVLDFASIFYDWNPNSSFMRGLSSFFSFYQPSIFIGYGYDLNHRRWHSPDLSLVFKGHFSL